MRTLNIDSDQGTGGVERGEIYDIYLPSEFLRLLDGPSCNTMDVTDVNVGTTDDFTKCVGEWGYCIGLETEECSTFPSLLFGRNAIDGRGMMCSVLTLGISGNQGVGDVEAQNYDIYFPPEFRHRPMARPAASWT